VETRTNEGNPEVLTAQAAEPINPEHVLDAWSTKTVGSQRFDRIRLERKDGEAFEALLDHETARDLGDKLTITAARLRYRSRGPSPISEAAGTPEEAGAQEDKGRALKVLALMGIKFGPEGVGTIEPLCDEFSALREDRAKAFAMVDEVQQHVAQRDRTIADQAQTIIDLRAELVARTQ